MHIEKKFDEEKCTILLSGIEVESVLSEIMDIISVNEFRVKSEFHITVAGFSRGREIKDQIEKNGADYTIICKRIRELLDETYFDISITHEVYHIAQEKKFSDGRQEMRESIIALVNISNFETFWASFEKILGFSLTPPFLHVTLATRGSGSEQSWQGIGIKDEQDFINLEKQKIER